VKNPLPAPATTTLGHRDPRSELAVDGLLFVQVAVVGHFTLLQQKESPLEMSTMTIFCASWSGQTLHTLQQDCTLLKQKESPQDKEAKELLYL